MFVETNIIEIFQHQIYGHRSMEFIVIRDKTSIENFQYDIF